MCIRVCSFAFFVFNNSCVTCAPYELVQQASQPLQRQISPPIALTQTNAPLGPIRPTPSQTTTTVPVMVQAQTSNIVGVSNPANPAIAVSNQIQIPSMASVVSSVPMFHATSATSVARPAHHYINANLTGTISRVRTWLNGLMCVVFTLLH